jgi:hypothetical protein
MGVRITHHIDRLAADMADIPVQARVGMVRVVASSAREGNRIAAAFATESAGSHGKHYPKAFDAEMRGELTWEYGPDASKPQGGMSFEFGSRNQKPHLDLAKSADIIGPKLADDVGDLVDKLFW